MATITKIIEVAAPSAAVWEALSDFDAVHERVAPGFVVDCRGEGRDRVVTFVTGSVARERLVTIDDEARRLVYTVVDGPLGTTHHQASVVVESVGERARLVWTTDVLPDERAAVIGSMMNAGADAIRLRFARVTA